MSSGRKDSDQWRTFAQVLRAHREQKRWSQKDLASRLNFSESLIAQVETCRRPPSMPLARGLDRVFGTPGYAPETSTSPENPGVFMILAANLRKMAFSIPFGSFAPHEASADELYVFEHSLIPGPLQTSGYARSVLGTRPNTTEDELDALVISRLARRDILTRSDPPPPLCWFLLDEGVLYRPVAPPKDMREQLLDLVTMSGLPNVTIQVLPYAAGGHTGLLGACTIAETAGQPSIVNLEDMSDGRVSEDPATVNEIKLRFKTLQSEALPKSASRQLILRAAEEKWTP